MQPVNIPDDARSATLGPSPQVGWRGILGFLAALGSLLAADTTPPMYQPPGTTTGGLDPHPTITSIVRTQNTATVTWSAFLKPFTVEQTPSLTAPLWEQILSTTNTQATVPTEGPMGMLRVQSPTPLYVGAFVCGACHEDNHAEWAGTHHANAFETLRSIHQETNPACIGCHTVGYGIPTGFLDEQHTPELEGVQCENCHGPGGRHVANTGDLSVRPVITIAAELCGGCHTGYHHPTYDEWKESGHGHQSEDFEFSGSGAASMKTCGSCHSGGARLANVKAFEDGTTNVVFNGVDADAFAVTCVVCHDPHELSDNPSQPVQLRYPTSSTQFFSYYTSTNFLTQYNPDVQVCGQCHNQRGAVWTGTGRPPHHSPQYNILVGQVADPATSAGTEFNGRPAGHGDPASNPMQCVTCHMQTETPETPSDANPVYTGHRFEVKTSACAECHGFADLPDADQIAEGGIQFIQSGTHAAMDKTLAALNEWAATKIPGLDDPTSTNYLAFYGTNAPSTVVPWEFNPIGQLNPGKVGPPTAGQKRLPNEILKARFLLYLVEHDGSYGVHNPSYVGSDPAYPGVLQKAEDLAKNAPAVPAN